MEDAARETRHLPAFVRNGLERIEAGPFVGETEFASIEIRETAGKGKKKRFEVRAEITQRGQHVLERDRRGVDPYLVMT